MDGNAIEVLCGEPFRKMVLLDLSDCKLPSHWKSRVQSAVPNAVVEIDKDMPRCSSDEKAVKRMQLVYR